jgi:hypothetical protein
VCGTHYFLLFCRGNLTEEGFLDQSGSWGDQVSFSLEDTINTYFYYYDVYIIFISCRVFALLTGEEGLIFISFQITQYLKEIVELLVSDALRCRRTSHGSFR